MNSTLLLSLAFLPLTVFAAVAILNALTFPRLRRSGLPRPAPFVSVLIPMRNETAVIAETVTSLLAQDYPNLEILLLDDQSTDGSAQLAQRFADGDARLTVLHGSPLPAGWLGKPWACHQLSERARGDYLLFTDADVRWEPNGVTALVAEALRSNADLLTAWPTQETVTWGERLVVPMMAFAVLAYLPALAVHSIPHPVFAAAMGQCLLFRRDAYGRIGGHAAIRSEIVDDMAFAYDVKRHRLRLRSADANGLLRTRMYRSWAQVRDGFAKNILAGHANNAVFLLLSSLFHWWLFLLPWIALVLQPTLIPALLIALAVLTRALTAATSRQRPLDSILLPLSVLLMTVIVGQSLRWRFGGGPQWKGRNLNPEANQP